MNTNFYGPLRIIKAVLPSMRHSMSGAIVNISSITGLEGFPSTGLYSASKFALEGLSESLACELDPWHIRVLLIEPWDFRTRMMNAIVKPSFKTQVPYKGLPVDAGAEIAETYAVKQRNNPVGAAERIVQSVEESRDVFNLKEVIRLPIGPDMMGTALLKVDKTSENVSGMQFTNEIMQL